MPDVGAATFALPHGLRVYAIGDIHGQLAALKRMWSLIEDDLVSRPCARATEVYLGDYVDRGPDSAGVIEALASRAPDGRSVHLLRGNHEEAFSRFMANGTGLAEWLSNGAVSTLASYGVRVNPLAVEAEAVRAALLAAVPAHHADFLDRLELRRVIGGFLFVHAGIRPGRPLERQSTNDLLRIRDPFLRSGAPLPFRVVHGHTPVREPEVHPCRINVDTGAFATGRLSCAVIEAETVRFITTSPIRPGER